MPPVMLLPLMLTTPPSSAWMMPLLVTAAPLKLIVPGTPAPDPALSVPLFV